MGTLHPPLVSEYSLRWESCGGATRSVWCRMGLIPRRITDHLDRTLALAERQTAALEAMEGSVRAQSATVVQFELPPTPEAIVVEHPDIAGLQARMADLTQAVADGIQRVARSENRVRAIVAGARRELSEAGFEHSGVEAEASELHDVDGKPSDEEQVPAVPADVDDSAVPSSIPGVTREQMLRGRGW